MENINTSPAAKDRAARAIAQAAAGDVARLTCDEIVGIVAHALTNYSPEATVAAHALREWNGEDSEMPRLIISPGEYAEIAQLVIDTADDYRKRHAAEPAPPPPVPFGQITPVWGPLPPAPPPPVLPGSAVDAVLSNVSDLLAALRNDLHRMAEREGNTVRRMDAAMLENRAKMCSNAIKALNTLRSDQCASDDCETTAMYGSDLCPTHAAHELFGTTNP